MTLVAMKLHQRLHGALVIECDHAQARTWAWYGDTVVYCFADSGELIECRSLEQLGLSWTLDRERMRIEVRAATLGLIPDPGYFARRQHEILGQHWRSV